MHEVLTKQSKYSNIKSKTILSQIFKKIYNYEKNSKQNRDRGVNEKNS